MWNERVQQKINAISDEMLFWNEKLKEKKQVYKRRKGNMPKKFEEEYQEDIKRYKKEIDRCKMQIEACKLIME